MTDPLQDSGVQGLAQLGRNAIERVAQLEAELAGALRLLEHEMRGRTKAIAELMAAQQAHKATQKCLDASERNIIQVMGHCDLALDRLGDCDPAALAVLGDRHVWALGAVLRRGGYDPYA